LALMLLWRVVADAYVCTYSISINAPLQPTSFVGRTCLCIRGYPEIAGLSYPFQKMLSIELDALPERTAAGKSEPQAIHQLEADTLTCHCRFARRYLSLCRPVFHLDGDVQVLTSEKSVHISLYLKSQGARCMRRRDLSK